MRRGTGMLAVVLAAGLAASAAGDGPRVTVGSKKFTESVVLGEMMAQLVRDAGVDAVHRPQLGGTRILWNALRTGEIDAYPEYTGTITAEILGGGDPADLAALREALAARGVHLGEPLGFDNTYALGMRADVADSLAIASVSDLSAHPDLRFGFTNEFMDRADGWPGLRRTYDLPQDDVRGIDHDLAYRGLLAGSIQVTDFYATDAELAAHDLRVLRDDRGHFPEYRAVVLSRTDLADRAPRAAAALARLAGTLTAGEMARLNARVRIDREGESRVAADFLAANLGVVPAVRESQPAARLWRRTREHLALVGVSLAAAVLVALPLGVLAARYDRLGQIVLGVTGILQTVPALALLVFMIPLLGIGAPPALAALFLYSLLPIVRNTHAGLKGIPASLHEVAVALGLPPLVRLWRVELPLAAPSILAGIKTSAVINVGTATLGALIGAGGYGQPILTGIRLGDTGLILQGAVPAALLALLIQGAFDLAERVIVPAGLRLRAEA